MAVFDPNRPFKIINRKSGTALSAAGTANDSRVLLWNFVGGGGQLWYVWDPGDGFLRIENRHSGRILAAPHGGTGNGAKLHVWDDLATMPEQHWTLDETPDGFVRLVNRASGRIAACSGGDTGNGTEILLWDTLPGFPDQEWTIVPVPAYEPTASYRVRNRKVDKVLCIVDAGVANGSRINLFRYEDAEDQRWHIVDMGNGFHKLVSQHSGRILSTVNGDSSNGTPLELWDDAGTACNQHWVITPSADGYVKITNRLCGRAVSCVLGGTADTTRVHLWEFLGDQPDQEWIIEKVDSVVDVDARVRIATTTEYMTGTCLEDVNHSVFGGVDSQMIFGESFQEPAPFDDPHALYKIINVNSGTALSVRRRGTENGSLATLFKDVDAPDQKWRIVSAGSGYSAILNHHNGKALSTLHGGSGNGTPIHLWDYLGAADQQWAIRGIHFQKTFRFMNRNSRRVASCLGGDAVDNTRLELFDWSAAFRAHIKYQNWILKPVTPLTRPEVSGMWRGFTRGSATGSFALLTTGTFNGGSHSQRITYTAGTGEVGIENRSLNRWGMNIQAGLTYEGYVYVRAASPTAVTVAFENADGDTTLAEASIMTGNAQWARHDFTLTPAAGDTRGRFVIKLPQPGSIDVGFVFVQPPASARYKALPVRRDLAEGLVAQGNTFLRFGGSTVKAGNYLWKGMLGPRELRELNGSFFYDRCGNGWAIFEFLEMAEAMGLPGIPAMNIDESADSLVEFLEYVNGSATTTAGGKRRAGNGRTQPYGLKYLQLGNELGNVSNEETYKFFDKFANLAPRLWAADPNIILVLGDWHYREVIKDPDHLQDAYVFNLDGHRKVLDLAAQYNREVWIDCHLHTDDVDLGLPGEKRFDGFVLKQIDALDSLYFWLTVRSPRAKFKLVVFEMNANSHDQHRALANAIAIGAAQRLGDKIRMVASANALQPHEQNDNVWDQGLMFFDSHRTWAQPAWYVTRMKSDHYQPKVVQARIHGRESCTFDVTATASDDGRTLLLHVVNTLDVPRRYHFNLYGFTPRSSRARFITLAGKPGMRNSAANPDAVVPHESTIDFPRFGNTITLEFPPNSFTIARLE